jgi:predicted short-subunit dehydrogenase-like oxidoreductase (DUF2520 family)
MDIGLIGAGKVGFSLGKYLSLHKISISGYYSQNPKSSKEAAEFTGTKAFNTMKQIVEVSDVLFLTVPDGHIAPLWEKLKEKDLAGKIIAHCSGALTTDVFQGADPATSLYSIHPLLAVSDKYESYKIFKDALFTIEGSPENMDKMCILFSSCGNRIQPIRKESKMLYHAAAAVASNFMVTIADSAQEVLKRCGFSDEMAKDALSVLMRENINSVIENGTEAALTGPIERNDAGTVKGHLSVLTEEEKALYLALARRTMKLAERKHPERSYQEMEEVLK